jgi:chromosome segregation ATPase
MNTQTQTQTQPTAVLGTRLQELSVRDICEEITDINRDLAVIEDYEKGYISFGELTRETMFLPDDKQRLEEAVKILREEKANRNNLTFE